MSMAANTELLKEDLERVANHNPQLLIHRNHVEELFQDTETYITHVVETARVALTLRLDQVPQAESDSIRSACRAVDKALNDIQEFNPSAHGRPSEEADRLKKALPVEFKGLFNGIMPLWLRLVSQTPASLKALEDAVDQAGKSKDNLGRIRGLADAALSKANTAANNAEQIVEKLRDLAKRQTVASFESHFGKLATEHKTQSRLWFAGAVLLGVATAASALILTWALKVTGAITDSGVVQALVARLVLVSVLYLGTIWCMRNYRSHKHMVVVNNHRQAALNAFESLNKAIGDDQHAKAVILLEASRCMFAPTVTGFLGPEENTPSLPIGDVFKGMAPK